MSEISEIRNETQYLTSYNFLICLLQLYPALSKFESFNYLNLTSAVQRDSAVLPAPFSRAVLYYLASSAVFQLALPESCGVIDDLGHFLVQAKHHRFLRFVVL